MNHNAHIKKLELLINFFKNGRKATWEEINDFLEQQEERLYIIDSEQSLAKSIRTFQRNKKAIAELFGLDILYDRKQKVYYLDNKEDIHADFTRIFEMSELMTLLQASELHESYIKLEKTQPKGLRHVNKLIQALRTKKCILLDYKKYTDSVAKQVLLHPILLKEYKNRWYLIAKNDQNQTKTYALDRTENVAITRYAAKLDDADRNLEEFAYAYGISSHQPTDKIPEVKLRFTYDQGQYIKALPLHHSQQVIQESKTEDECVISLNVTPSTELIMDILSHGSQVVVLQPKSLATQIKKIITEMTRLY